MIRKKHLVVLCVTKFDLLDIKMFSWLVVIVCGILNHGKILSHIPFKTSHATYTINELMRITLDKVVPKDV